MSRERIAISGTADLFPTDRVLSRDIHTESNSKDTRTVIDYKLPIINTPAFEGFIDIYYGRDVMLVCLMRQVVNRS